MTVPQYNIDVTKLEAALSPKTKAVMIAHTLGNPFDLSAVKAFCDAHNLWLVEDNCDALGTQYTINLPENVHISSASFAGYANEDNKTCYLAELGGSSFGSDLYVFPSRSTDTSTKTQFDVTLGTSATGTLTFTSGDAQAAWVITLKGIKASSTGIHGITTAPAGSKGNIYDLSGRVIKKQATTADLASLSKGIYILNNKKYVVK